MRLQSTDEVWSVAARHDVACSQVERFRVAQLRALECPPVPQTIAGAAPGQFSETGIHSPPWRSLAGIHMIIRAGFEAAFDFTNPTTVLLMAYVHPSRAPSIRRFEGLAVTPSVEVSSYIDAYGNLCGRTCVPAGRVTFWTDAHFEDDGLPDLQAWNALQHEVRYLPNDVLLFLLASRYCEVDSEL